VERLGASHSKSSLSPSQRYDSKERIDEKAYKKTRKRRKHQIDPNYAQKRTENLDSIIKKQI
jgi:hypothetical protein